jgi:hypothetical protein
MPFDVTTGLWKSQSLEYWRKSILEQLKLNEKFEFDISVASNVYTLASEEAAQLMAMDAQVGLSVTQIFKMLEESKILIEGSKSITASGIRSAFLSLAPLVQECSIIQATPEREDWYIFLELDKPFSEATEEEIGVLLSMGSSTQGLGKLSSKYPDPIEPPTTIQTIEGYGMIDGSYQKQGVYTILNEIIKTTLPNLLIKVIVLEGFEDSVHYSTERTEITNDFKKQFNDIQKIHVDFIKVDYACVIHNSTRQEWMYEFYFYDNTDTEAPVIKDQIVVNEYEYLILPQNIKVSFYKQGVYNEDGTYTEGELIQ